MSKFVLDASALMALLNNEAGAEVVAQALPNAMMSAVNYCECASIMSNLGIPDKDIKSVILDLVPHIESFDVQQAHICALLRPLMKSFGLSLGDRACFALAKTKMLPVITADRIWEKVDCGVQVILIR